MGLSRFPRYRAFSGKTSEPEAAWVSWLRVCGRHELERGSLWAVTDKEAASMFVVPWGSLWHWTSDLFPDAAGSIS